MAASNFTVMYNNSYSTKPCEIPLKNWQLELRYHSSMAHHKLPGFQSYRVSLLVIRGAHLFTKAIIASQDFKLLLMTDNNFQTFNIDF